MSGLFWSTPGEGFGRGGGWRSITWACWSSLLSPYMIPRALVFSCSNSTSVTGGSTTRLPAAAFGSASVASYDRFCCSFVEYCS
ncbi:hypothetical protein [Micromonospora purpureochromogenes]|uniref:hypothetical protein n=1 Tax=Micromonospora purpureochromogenes TaxID=47872 RepID=UPI0012FD99B9